MDRHNALHDVWMLTVRVAVLAWIAVVVVACRSVPIGPLVSQPESGPGWRLISVGIAGPVDGGVYAEVDGRTIKATVVVSSGGYGDCAKPIFRGLRPDGEDVFIVIERVGSRVSGDACASMTQTSFVVEIDALALPASATHLALDTTVCACLYPRAPIK